MKPPARKAGKLGATLLAGLFALAAVGCSAQRPTSSAADARAAQARARGREADPLLHPRVVADAEVKRLTSWREQLITRLRGNEDRLLQAVRKSADYDPDAATAVTELQDERLLLTVALQQLEAERLRRARDIVDEGAAAAPPAPPLRPAISPAAGKDDAKKKEKAAADALDPLLQRARLSLEQAAARERMRRDGFSRGMSQMFGVGAAAPAPDLARRKRQAATKPDALDRPFTGVGVAAPDGAHDEAGDDDAWEGEAPPATDGRSGGHGRRPGGVAAAAVMVNDDTPQLGPALQRQLPRMQACIPPEQLQNGVSFTVRARLAKDGRVRGARLSGSHGLSPSVAACVVGVLTKVRLSGGGAGRMVSVPMRISGR